MLTRKKFLLFLFPLLTLFVTSNLYTSSLQTQSVPVNKGGLHTSSIVGGEEQKIITAADQTRKYLSYLKGKRIGMVVNPTSIIGNTPIVDSLKALEINIVKIFGPEHGFRGNASNGAKVDDTVDPKTGIPVISLYGKKYKPTK